MAENRSRLIAVWPWKAERYKLWSLLDMMKFEFEQVANLLIVVRKNSKTVMQRGPRDCTRGEELLSSVLL